MEFTRIENSFSDEKSNHCEGAALPERAESLRAAVADSAVENRTAIGACAVVKTNVGIGYRPQAMFGTG